MFIENDAVAYGVKRVDGKWILGTLTTLRGFATRTTWKRRRMTKPSRSIKEIRLRVYFRT
jgi:hypothetical protein